MTDSTLVDLVKIFSTTQGIGTITLGANVPAFRGVAALVDGSTYDYSIQQGANWEFGTGLFSAGGTTLTRGVIGSSYGGAPIPLGPNAIVTFTALSSSLLRPGPEGPIGPRGIGVPTPVTAIGASYTLTEADVETYLLFENAGAATLTIPANSDVALPDFTVVFYEQHSTGQVTVVGADGVTVNSRGNEFKTAGQFAVAQIKQVAPDVWTVIGDTVA